MADGNQTDASRVSELSQVLPGKFIAVDGIDGSGKTSLIAGLQRALREYDLEVEIARDPGGTRTGDAIRQLVLQCQDDAICPRCETLLFMAARAQLVAEVIASARERGACVLCDRFVSSTLAYQVAAGVRASDVGELGEFAIAGCWPDLTIILDVGVEEAFKRTGRKVAPGPVPNHLKNDHTQLPLIEGARLDMISQRSASYFRRVRSLFLKLHLNYPTPVRVVDARSSMEATLHDALATIRDIFCAQVKDT